MDSQKIISTTAKLIRYDFALEEIEAVWTEEALIRYLIPCINQYLECNLEGLFRVLYRLDIRETAVHAILSPAATEANQRTTKTVPTERPAPVIR